MIGAHPFVLVANDDPNLPAGEILGPVDQVEFLDQLAFAG